MAVTQAQKVDFLLKKIGFTKTKTGLAVDESLSGTKKAGFAEAIASPLIIANDSLWNESAQIPTTPPTSDTSQVRVYLSSSSGHQMTSDSTVAGNRAFIAFDTYNNSSSTRLNNWIDTQFGASYLIKVFKGDPNSGGVQLSAAGSGNNDGWFFDYSAGVLNFNDTNVPSGVTSSNIYIVGYRYIGLTGAPTPTGGGNFTFDDLNVTGDLDVDGHTNLDNVSVSGISTFKTVLIETNNRLNLRDINASIYDEGGNINIERAGAGGIILVANSAGGTTGNILLKSGSVEIIKVNGDGGVVVTGILTATTFSGPLTGNVTGNVSGNAGTATALQTARNIGGVSFDGTQDIDLPGVNIIGNQDTSGNAGTATALQTARNIGGVSFDGTADINLPGVNVTGNQNTSGNAATATALQNARTIGGVSFDGTSNIDLPGVNIAGNQDTSGNSATATALQNARTIGGVSFDGTSNIDLPGVNTGGNQDTSGNSATATALQTARNIGGVSFDGTSDINLPGVNTSGNQNTSGNAATATALQNARTIGGVSFDGTANINLPGVNTAGNQDTSGNAATATALQNARTIGGVSFDGTSNIDLPGVNISGNQNTSGTAAGLSGTPNIAITNLNAVDGTFTGNVSIGGTLTYEDVTNIDSVGIGTFREGIFIPDAKKLEFGNASGSADLRLYHDGTNSYIQNTGALKIPTGSLKIKNTADNEAMIMAYQNNQVELYFNGAKKLETTNTGAIVTGILTATTFSGPLTGDVTGNAASATALETARNIGGVSFDGTANIDLPGVNIAGNQSTSGNAATATALETARTIGGVSFDGTADISLPGVNIAGNQSTSGNAATATALQTARTIGGVSFDGTANINLPGVNAIGNQDTSGNSATTTALQNARTIGGVSFDGTANIDLPGVNIAGNQNTSGTAAGLSGTPSINITDLDVDGHTDLDNVSVSGISTFGADVLPSAHDSYDLGSTTKKWAEVHASTFYGDGSQLNGISVDASALKDSNGNVKIQAQASGAVHTGIATFQDLDVDGHTELDNVNVSGISTFNGNVQLGDSSILGLGAAGFNGGVSDLRFYHNGSSSNIINSTGHFYIVQNASGKNLYLKAPVIQIQDSNSNDIITTATNGGITVKHNNSTKLETSASGVTVTGTVIATGADVNGDLDVDGHTNLDNVSVAGVTTFSGGSVTINPAGANHSTFTINSNESNDSPGPIINLSRNNGFFSSTEPLGEIRFVANNNKNYGKITGRTTTTGSGTEDGKIQVSAIKNGTETVVTEFTHNGVDIPFDLDVDGHTNLDNVSVAGITTFNGIIDAVNTPASIRVAQDIQHKGDADTKISFPSADTITFDTAGTERLNIASNGNITVANDLGINGNATFNSTITAGGVTGTNGQYLKSTGTGVAWDSFPTMRTTTTVTASAGQTTFSFTYNVGFLDVFINGTKLTDSEFTATNGSSVVLAVGCFVGDIVDLISYNTVSGGGGGGGAAGITVQDEGSSLSTDATTFNFVGTGIVASGTGATKTITVNAGTADTTDVRTNTLQVVGVSTLPDIRSDSITFKNAAGGATYATFTNGGSVLLKHNNTDRLETTSSGVDVTGTLTVNGSAISGGGFSPDAQNNLVSGTNAGNSFSGTDANHNLLLGFDAGTDITSGDDNIFLGRDAGKSTTTMSDNVYIGPGCGESNNASNNVCIGNFAGGKLTGAQYNIYIGYQTGEGLFSGTKTGSYNIAFGRYSLAEITTGNRNVVLGDTAGNKLQMGTDNIIIGTNAGSQSSRALVNGSNNILIGNDAEASASGVSNEITLGHTEITKFRIPGINFILKDNGGTPTQGHVLTVDSNGEASFAAASGGGGSDVGITTALTGTFDASNGVATINTYSYHDNDKVVEYTVYIKNGSDFQTSKVLAMRDSTTIHSTQFAVMFSSSLLVQFDATISSGNINLRATPETGVTGSTSYRIKREVM